MALKIYLDNQDFSFLLYKTDSETVDIKNYLIKKSESNEISIGYSFFHLAEFLTDYDEAHREDRMKRTAFIKMLCKRNAFIYVTKLSPNTEVLSESGEWSPDRDLLMDMKKGVLDFVNKLPNQARNSNAKDNLKKYLRAHPNILNTDLSGLSEIPMPESFKKSNIFMRWVAGQVPDAYMRKQVNEYLNDIDLFREVWFEYGNQRDALHDSLTQMANPYLQMIPIFEGVLEKIENYRIALKKIKKDPKLKFLNNEIGQTLVDTETTFKNIENIDLAYLKSIPQVAKKLASFPDENISSVLAFVKGKVRDGTKIKSGDHADILHSMYLPYVDLWRCDLHTFQILRKGDVVHLDKIVSRLTDLPAAIENLLVK